eukprot:m.352704 g.352704  ORF g.352704 m.352704 type:complete len:173 (+) comp16595_c0_seq1:216-734(+)
MAARKARGRQRRVQRATSNVFAMFDEAQIQEFKEAFNLIDQSRKGHIDEEDLKEMYSSLGQTPSDEEISAMLREAPGKLNFTMFLTLFGEKMTGTDPEDVIKNAFACFDPENTGKLDEEKLRSLLTTMGDRFSDEEVDEMFRGAPIDEAGLFDYRTYTRVLKNGAKEEGAAA